MKSRKPQRKHVWAYNLKRSLTWEDYEKAMTIKTVKWKPGLYFTLNAKKTNTKPQSPLYKSFNSCMKIRS
jgi:hypothetical protein